MAMSAPNAIGCCADAATRSLPPRAMIGCERGVVVQERKDRPKVVEDVVVRRRLDDRADAEHRSAEDDDLHEIVDVAGAADNADDEVEDEEIAEEERERLDHRRLEVE